MLHHPKRTSFTLFLLLFVSTLLVSCGQQQPVFYQSDHLMYCSGTAAPAPTAPIPPLSVYIGTGSGNLLAFDAANGNARWCVHIGYEGRSTKNSGMILSALRPLPPAIPVELGTPVVAQGVVYVSSVTGYIYAFQARDGKFIWRSLVDDYSNSSLTFAAGAIYGASINYGGDSHIFALDASNGKVLWRVKTSGGNFSAPAVVNGVVYVGSSDGHLYALNAINGTARWVYNTGTNIYSTPAIINGIVYFGSGYRGRNVYALNASDGSVRWQQRLESIGSSPVVLHGVLYISSDAAMYALNALDGSVRWRYRAVSVNNSTPTIESGTLYFTSDSIYALTIKDGSLRWSEPLGNEGTYPYIEPVVAHGILYVDTWRTILAQNAATGNQRWSKPDIDPSSSPVVAP